jgi:hypothetical protein
MIVDHNPAGLPSPTTDAAEGVDNLHRYGVTIHPQFVTPDMVCRLFERVQEQADEERRVGVAVCGDSSGVMDLADPGVPPMPYQRVDFLPNKGRVFIDVAVHPLACQYAEEVFGARPFHVFSQSAIITRRGLADQLPHIDQINLPAEMCTIPAILNVFLCLTGMDVSMGATRLAPGTHVGARPDYKRGDKTEVTYFPAEVEAGTAVIWEGRLWHGGSAHSSDRMRAVVSTDYGLACIKPNENYPAGLLDSVYETLTSQELDMFGFRAEMNRNNNRFVPRNRDDRRTNTNFSAPYVSELERSK